MLTTEEIKKELDAGREVELECVDKEGFIKQGIRHVRESTLESSLIVDYITNYGSGLHVKIKDLKSSISAGSLKYFRIKRPAPTFDDVIDKTVQAMKDGVIAITHISTHRVKYEHERPYPHENDVYQVDRVDDKDFLDFINQLDSLYTETFVIENNHDIMKAEKGASGNLANGQEFVIQNDAYSYTNKNKLLIFIDGEPMHVNLGILKGATVTQKRGEV